MPNKKWRERTTGNPVRVTKHRLAVGLRIFRFDAVDFSDRLLDVATSCQLVECRMAFDAVDFLTASLTAMCLDTEAAGTHKALPTRKHVDIQGEVPKPPTAINPLDVVRD